MALESGQSARQCSTFVSFEREGGATEATEHCYPSRKASGSEAGNPFFQKMCGTHRNGRTGGAVARLLRAGQRHSSACKLYLDWRRELATAMAPIPIGGSDGEGDGIE